MREEPRFTDTLSLVALPTAVAVTRLFVADTLHRWHAMFIEPDMEAIASELVAVSVEATGPPEGTSWTNITGLRSVTLRLLGFERHIVVEVADEHDEPLTIPEGTELPGSSGVMLVDARARRWGSRLTTWGRVMWAELDVYERSAAGLPRRPVMPSPHPRASSSLEHTVLALDLLQRVRDGLHRL